MSCSRIAGVSSIYLFRCLRLGFDIGYQSLCSFWICLCCWDFTHLSGFGDVTSISWINALFACFIALIEIGHYNVHLFVSKCDQCQRTGNITKRNEMPLNNILEVEFSDVWVLISWDHFLLLLEIITYWWRLTMCPNRLRPSPLPLMMHK